jgi:hypothetical protein
MSAIKTNVNNFGPSGPAADGKPNIKGRVLIALTRLNDKDTQRFAVEELFQIVRVRRRGTIHTSSCGRYQRYQWAHHCCCRT